MKKLLLSVLSIAFIAGFAIAQPPHGKKPMEPKKKIENKKGMHKPPFAKALNLSPEQKEKAKEIGKAFHEKVQKLKSNDNITMGEYKKQLARLEKERKEKMDALLTTEQKSKLNEMKKKGEENMQVKNAARLERMKIDLSLTEEQVTKIKSLQQQLGTSLKSIRENENITIEEKKEKLHTAMLDNRDAIKKILTKEQQDKFENFKQRKQERKAK